MDSIKKEQKPLGLVVFAAANLVVFGVLPLTTAAMLLFNHPPSLEQDFSQELKLHFPGMSLKPSQITAILIAQIGVAAVFCISGLGLMLRKEWARRVTLGFSFFVVLIAFLAALFNRAIINKVIIQIIYPGALILYFTNPKITQYFCQSSLKEQEKT